MIRGLGAEPFAIVASRIRPDEKRILEAFDRRGLGLTRLDSRTLWTVLSTQPLIRPTVVVNREIGHARAAAAARMLEAATALVLNSARATDTCADKYRTSVALHAEGLPTPRTALALTPGSALDALDEIGYPAVVKPRFGSWGRRVSRVRDREEAEAVLDQVAALPSPGDHIVYLQEYVAGPGRDIRVVVVGKEVLGAAYRIGAGWRHNVARGATTARCQLSGHLIDLAVGAARATGADIAGVDLVEDGDGRLYVLEVNHGVEFSGFQDAVGERLRVADRIVDHAVRRARSCDE